jgi:hypothetical protein
MLSNCRGNLTSLLSSAVDLELECDALDQVQTLTDLYAPAIDARVGADPSIQIEEPTGQTFNTCDR